MEICYSGKRRGAVFRPHLKDSDLALALDDGDVVVLQRLGAHLVRLKCNERFLKDADIIVLVPSQGLNR